MSQINKILSVLKSVTNPKQAIDLMLSKMPNEQSQLFKEMMNSKSPEQAIKEMSQQGKISLQQLNEARNYYNLVKKFGIKVKIPDEVWVQAESAIKSNNLNNPRSNSNFRF